MQSQNSSQKTWLYRLREAVWPLLDPELPEHPFPDETVVVEEENLDQAFELISKFAASEEERLKTVESKATLLLSTISVATTVIVASNTVLTGNTERSWPVISSVGISFVLCLYTTMTVWYAIKALKRGAYNVLSFKDINHQGNKESYRRHLILSTWKKTRGNFRTINHKVDYMHMAQIYYQRGIIVIGCYALLIFILCLFYRPAAPANVKTTVTPYNAYPQSKKDTTATLPLIKHKDSSRRSKN